MKARMDRIMGNNRQDLIVEGICGLIIAAGYSSRMGSFKPLLPIGDMSAIERIIASLRDADLNNILVVIGYNKELLEPILNKNQVDAVYNKDFSQGMFTSIKAGMVEAIKKYGDTLKGFLLWPVDCPMIPSEIIQMILEKNNQCKDSFIVPCYKGKKGHPLFIPRAYTDEILSYQGEEGLKGVIRPYDKETLRIETDIEAVVLDMDTPESYEEILQYYRKVTLGDPEEEEQDQVLKLLGGRRLFLVRHGETQQHQEKVFIGQVDVLLSDEGRIQAKEAGNQLNEMGVNAACIYTSDLSRAKDTARIISEVLAIPLIEDNSFREIALGEWEGLSINEVKEKFPDEYAERGKNLITYKLGNNSENFYDLQYRVMKGFRRILKEETAEMSEVSSGQDKKKDIILVTHAGVIKVILSNLYGRDLEELLKETIPKGSMVSINV